MNEILLIIEIIFCFSSVLVMYKIFGKYGIYAWVAFASVIANIQVTKNVDIFGIHATLGNVLFATVFFSTCVLTENHSKSDGYRASKISFFCIIAWLIISQITICFVSNNIDTVADSMDNLFSLSIRVSLSSAVIFFIANCANAWLYGKLKSKFGDKVLWLKGNVSMILCNCLENFAFVFLAFLGVYSAIDCLILAASTCAVEFFVTACSTPFLYIAKKIKPINQSSKLVKRQSH